MAIIVEVKLNFNFLKAIIIATIILPSDPISLNDRPYPAYSIAIGWVIVALPISAIPVCAIYQFILKHKDGKNYVNEKK